MEAMDMSAVPWPVTVNRGTTAKDKLMTVSLFVDAPIDAPLSTEKAADGNGAIAIESATKKPPDRTITRLSLKVPVFIDMFISLSHFPKPVR